MSGLFPESWTAGALPDLPDTVHGIKARDPWVVQCDDCLTCFEDRVLLFAAQQVLFSSFLPGVRLCADCWKARGFVRKDGMSWRPR